METNFTTMMTFDKKKNSVERTKRNMINVLNNKKINALSKNLKNTSFDLKEHHIIAKGLPRTISSARNYFS